MSRCCALRLFAFAIVIFIPFAPALGAEDDDKDAATSRPSEIRRGLDMGGTRAERSRRAYENVIRKIEPTLVGKPERLPQYLDLFKREFVEDPRTFAFNVSANSSASGAITMTGWVEFDEHQRSLAE